jgi:predicted ATPase
LGLSMRGHVLVEADRAEDALHVLTAAIAASQSTGSTVWMPLNLSYLARAYAALGQFENAWRCLSDAMTAAETTKERWYEAEIYRVAGEIALLSPSPDRMKAEDYFARALAIAGAQEARSWELRTAMSLARLWCEKGKRQQARDCLASVHAWFTEGFDTADLRQASALLDALSSDDNTRAALPTSPRPGPAGLDASRARTLARRDRD